MIAGFKIEVVVSGIMVLLLSGAALYLANEIYHCNQMGGWLDQELRCQPF